MRSIEEILDRYASVFVAEIRNPVVFYLGVAGLFIIGALLVIKTPTYSDAGGSEYERRRNLRFVGMLSMAFALGFFGVKEYTVNVLTYSIDADSLPVSNHVVEAEAAPMYASARPSFPFPRNAPINYPYSASNTTKEPETARVDLPSSQVNVQPSSESPADHRDQVKDNPTLIPPDQIKQLLGEAAQLVEKKQLEAALDAVNAVIQSAPQNPNAYLLRGSIYGEKKLWDQAEKDFQTALRLDPGNVPIKFDLAEFNFAQKKYDEARLGFHALEHDSNMGDIASYKLFLCDLLGGHEDNAAKELDAFNQTGSNPSYYFANAAWHLYHQKPEDARGWLMSATRIYAPGKFKQYAFSLIGLGYLPLPPPPNGGLITAR